jgi:hypothetical protein
MGEGWGEGDRAALSAIGPGFSLLLETSLSRKKIAGKKKYAFGSLNCTRTLTLPSPTTKCGRGEYQVSLTN